MNIVLVWIGWAGMSSIAYICQRLWYNNIVWIDQEASQITQWLESQWIKIIIWHGKYIPQENDFIIYSQAAINSPEVQKSFEYQKLWKKHFHKAFSYFEFIWEISKYFQTISIAWTHGKSTSTALMICTLQDLAPNLWIGIVWALVPQLNNTNYFVNSNLTHNIKNIFDHIFLWDYVNFDHDLVKKYYFIIESCEYNRHFLYLDPDYAAILNIELDHSDVFSNFNEYMDAYVKFSLNVRHKIFWLKNDNNFQTLSEIFPNKSIIVNNNSYKFNNLFGQHNHNNASIIQSMINNIFPSISKQDILKNFKTFDGLWRRMEYLGHNLNWTIIYTDYAHHPSEIKAVFKWLKEKHPDKKLIAVFQPHQARRVLEFWDNFIQSLEHFDKTYIYNIYTARENLFELINKFAKSRFKDIQDITTLGQTFWEQCNWQYIEDFQQIVNIINQSWKETIIIIMSAWNLDFQIRKSNIAIK